MRVDLELESNETGRISVSIESEKATAPTVLMQTAFMAVENEINAIHASLYGG